MNAALKRKYQHLLKPGVFQPSAAQRAATKALRSQSLTPAQRKVLARAAIARSHASGKRSPAAALA